MFNVIARGCLACALLHGCDGASLDGLGSIDGGVDAAPEDLGPDARRSPDSGPVEPPDDARPTVTITSPTDGAAVDAATLRVEGTARDDGGVASVFVSIGPNVPRLAATADGFRTWSLELPLAPGEFTLEAVAIDRGGRRSDPVRVRVRGPETTAGARAPMVTIVRPESGPSRRSEVLVEGVAEDDAAIVRMEVTRNGTPLVERPVATEDYFARWAHPVLLIPGITNRLVYRAFDALGNSGEATVVLEAAPVVDREPPLLTLVTPAPDATIDASTLTVTGRASDRVGVREVVVRLGVPDAEGSVRFGEAQPAQTRDGFAFFEAELEVPPGPLVLDVRAIDVSGLATRVEQRLTNLLVAPYGAERRLPLFVRDDPAPTVRLELDAEAIDDVIAEPIQRDLELFDLDPGALIVSSLERIKTACGTAWRADRSDPRHDCSLTPLGRTFRGPDGRWQTSAEYALVRIATMTPANVVVSGTSIAGLQGLADALRLGGGFSQILAGTLGIGRTQEIVGTTNLAEAFRVGLVATHPATRADGAIPITLYDMLNALEPLGITLGPAGDHPGIVDPSTPPRGDVIADDFLMTLVATSNLRWFDGIDLSIGKEYLALVVDTTGVSRDDVLEFDFVDPGRFFIDGLVEAPVVDLRLRILENDRFLDSCNGNDRCQANLPSTPLAGFVWDTPSWEAEHIVGFGAYNQYRTRRVRLCPGGAFTCFLAEIEVGQGGDPAGWTDFNTFLGLGSPPRDQYAWELINEVAQVALHRLPSSTIAEGDADVAFTLEDIPVGVTADGIRDAVRPVLQDQASELSERLLGDFARNNGAVDFYYRRASDGVPTLYFAAPDDPRPTEYAYGRPGFYADEDLTTLLSTRTLPGVDDVEHEKLRLRAGETVVYVEDDEGAVYRLRFVAESDHPEELEAFVARRVR